MSKEFPQILTEWQFEGFNAYIVCPHLYGKFLSDSWAGKFNKNNIENLVQKLVLEKNIDENKIYIIGFSLGGQGALYMAHELSEIFDKCVVISGYPINSKLLKAKIPTIGYVGTTKKGEDVNSFSFMNYRFTKIFGKEKLFILPYSHNKMPYAVFALDEDKNNRSDVIEWLLEG